MQKSEFCMVWVQSWIMKRFLDRSASFFGQETHEHVKTIKKRCLETKHSIFKYLEVCFPEGFPSMFRLLVQFLHISDPKLTF